MMVVSRSTSVRNARSKAVDGGGGLGGSAGSVGVEGVVGTRSLTSATLAQVAMTLRMCAEDKDYERTTPSR